MSSSKLLDQVRISARLRHLSLQSSGRTHRCAPTTHCQAYEEVGLSLQAIPYR